MFHFVDIGAHRGEASSRFVGRGLTDVQLHLFEPNPTLMRLLEERFKYSSNVRLNETAFHIKEGEADMYTPDPESESSSLYAEKKTSPGAPVLCVKMIDGPAYLKNLDSGPIVLFSNCEGSEFDFMPVILDMPELVDRIKLWAIGFHHGQRKIPTMRPAYEKIQATMDALGIENPNRHYSRSDIRDGKLDRFIDEVVAVYNEQ